MLTLEGDGLRALLLEPGVDDARLGSRYVAGGYVWQVTDLRAGALLAGPAFPDAEPPVFDGQGLPEVFETALGAERASVGDDVYVLGVGRVRRDSSVRPFHVRDNPRVVERAAWTMKATATGAVFATRGAFADFSFELRREIAVRGRTLESSTWLRNAGARELPVRWFAHPFFPWPDGEVCRLALEYALPDGAALVENERGFLERRTGVDWTRGHYLTPRVTLGAPLRFEQRHPLLGVHPLLGAVHVECRFPLGGLALWGNGRTFSVEPFLQTLLAPGAEQRWSIAYTF